MADTDGAIQADEAGMAAGPHGKEQAKEHRRSPLDRYTVAVDTEAVDTEAARTALAHMAAAQAAKVPGAEEEETEP